MVSFGWLVRLILFVLWTPSKKPEEPDRPDKPPEPEKPVSEGSERSSSTLTRRHSGSVGSFLWGTRHRRLEHATDLFLESRQIPFYHGPDFRRIDTEIVVDQHMAHFDDLWPGDLLVGLAKGRGELAGCFADDLDMVNHPGVNEFVFLENPPTALRIPFDPLDGIEDILQASAIIPHKAIASLRTSFRSGRRSPRSEATSTGRLSKRSKSRTKAA